MPASRRALLSLALLSLAAAIPARATDPVAPWSFDLKKGDVLKYRTYIRISGRMADDSGDLLLTTRSESRHDVKDVTADGVATYEQLDEKSEAAFNGKPVPPPAGKPLPVTVTLAKNGVMLKRVNPTADPASIADKTIVAVQAVPVPPGTVKVGDTWKTEIPNPVIKGKTLTAVSTFQGTEKVLGLDALKVEMKMEFPTVLFASDFEIMQISVTYYVDLKDHQLLRAGYVIKNSVLPFPAKNVEARVLVSRIIPGQNDMTDPEGDTLIAPAKK